MSTWRQDREMFRGPRTTVSQARLPNVSLFRGNSTAAHPSAVNPATLAGDFMVVVLMDGVFIVAVFMASLRAPWCLCRCRWGTLRHGCGCTYALELKAELDWRASLRRRPAGERWWCPVTWGRPWLGVVPAGCPRCRRSSLPLPPPPGLGGAEQPQH